MNYDARITQRWADKLIDILWWPVVSLKHLSPILRVLLIFPAFLLVMVLMLVCIFPFFLRAGPADMIVAAWKGDL